MNPFLWNKLKTSRVTSFVKTSNTRLSQVSRSSNVNAKKNSHMIKTYYYSTLNEIFKPTDLFVHRHIGPRDTDIQEMLKTLELNSLDELVLKTVPKNILLNRDLKIGEERGEEEFLEELKSVLEKNKTLKSFIGMGYYNTILPNVIKRNILENPAWYTPYTPYQSEIAQGRLESLMNFQTMISDLTGMEITGASLLDEATAAAEAMFMCLRHSKNSKTFIVSHLVHPQVLDVIKTRAGPYGLQIEVTDVLKLTEEQVKDAFGVFVSYPATDGSISQFKAISELVHNNGGLLVASTDLLALTIIKPPSEFNTDIVVGSSQRFGVPLGFGGPHAGFLSTRDQFKRSMPGRIIGSSIDAKGKVSFRMALGTREQHIRREKATSNICTAQALLANISAMYAIYHGPEGLKNIANSVHMKTCVLKEALTELGFKIPNTPYFDTLSITTPLATQLFNKAEENGINIRLFNEQTVSISFDEPTTLEDVKALIEVFEAVSNKKLSSSMDEISNRVKSSIPSEFLRTSPILTHKIFNMFHSEHEMLRYMYRLQQKDLGLTFSMIPLGSCTMKLNATSEMVPITWNEVSNVHPFVPSSQSQGYLELFNQFEDALKEITGFDNISFQPNAGSQGEYAGLLSIRSYHIANGDSQRDICLIPISAHGTNPASAAMASMKVEIVKCDSLGNIDVEDLKLKAEKFKDRLACVMITYPSTHGVFEESVKEICEVIHKYGGQVYMDGANMNAQVGLTRPRDIGADVCHLNLHKTFCIPHGGGGPGVGPIGVSSHLAPYLPGHPVVPINGRREGTVSAAPWGSASILPISYTYIKMMGSKGLKKATQVAILNANYMAQRLKDHYKLVYQGLNGMVGHEFIIDLRPFKQYGVEAEDIAKRLMDYSFHSPTLSFPVAGTLMIEPTESESKSELDRFCSAMIQIRTEIQEVVEGKVPKDNNVLKNAPHTQEVLISSEWNHPYTREQAAYPLPYLKSSKFWPTVSRVDNVYGDRNLNCSCPPIENYM